MKEMMKNMKFVMRHPAENRILHWTFASAILLLIITGIIMNFFGAESGSIQKVLHFLGAMALIYAPSRYLIKNKGKRAKWSSFYKWDKYNKAQRYAFLLIFVFTLIVGISGLILMFGLFPDSKWLTLKLHNISTIVFIAFLLVHGTIYLTMPHRRALRSMLKGIMDVKYAEKYHKLWFDKVKSTAFLPQNMNGKRPDKAKNQ